MKRDFKSELNHFASNKTPCFFMVNFDKTQYHIEPLSATQSRYLYRFKEGKKSHTNVKINKKEPISQRRYEEAFSKVQHHMQKGDTYLLNLTFPTKIEGDLDLRQIYENAQTPFCCMKKDEFVCFSPEEFVRIEDGYMHTFPMKGTIKADVKNAKKIILNDEKELAEHTMIVDLMRNDLSMVCTNVELVKFRYIQKVKTNEGELLQVSSHIKGKLPENWQERLGDIFDSILPAGSISGTPKKSTLKIIKDVEGYDRGFYTGVFGVFTGQSVKSAVMIRFIQKDENGYSYKSGGGITVDSHMQKEYEEMRDKVYVPMF